MERKSTILALVGKGGVGKTSLSALTVRLLSEAFPEKRILAIDADPAVGLATALGVETGSTVDDIRKAFVQSVEGGRTRAAIELLGEARYRMLDALVERDNIAFLAIGRPESAGCYCKVNAYLKEVIAMVAEQFDFVIVPNSHSHETMPKAYYDDKEKHKDFILEAFYNILSCDVSRYVTAIAHPFSLVRCPYPCDDLIRLVSDDEFKRLFAQTAEKNIAIELNLGSFLGGLGRLGLEPAQMDRCQLMRMFRLAKAEGCKFLFGSDAHAPSHLNCFEDADLLAQTLELQDTDIAPIALGG